MASEIAELKNVEALELSHDNKKSWNFFREAGKNVLWPHVETEYREELQGIVAGVNAKGVKLDWSATWRQWIRSGAERAVQIGDTNVQRR